MEIAICDICAANLTPGSPTNVRRNGKIYCAECARLNVPAPDLPNARVIGPNDPTGEFVPVISPAAASAPVTKFYFCETCNKRITDQQILDGLGRDKKLKGVYCKDCAVGVMTMEFDAISDEDLRKSSRKSGGNAVPVNRESSSDSKRTPPMPGKSVGSGVKQAESRALKPAVQLRTPTQSQSKAIAIVIAVSVALAVIGILALTAGSPAAKNTAKVDRSEPTPPVSPAVEKNQPQASPPVSPPRVTTPELPLATHATTTPGAENNGAKTVTDSPPKEVVAKEAGVPAVPLAITSGPDSTPAVTAPEIQRTQIAPAVVNDEPDPKAKQPEEKSRADADAATTQKQFFEVLKELAPLLKRNQFNDADRLLDDKLRNPAYSAIQVELKREKVDLAGLQAFRSEAIAALQEKAGTLVSLKKGTLTGVIILNKEGVSIVLKNGPELAVNASQLDPEDVCNLVPIESGKGKSDDLARRGMLFLAAGDTAKAEEFFVKSRDSGPNELATRHLDRIAAQKLAEREILALAAWKKAEDLYENKSWDAARHAYEAIQRDYGGLAVMEQNLKTLKAHLDAIADLKSLYLCDMAETEVRVGHGKFGKKGDLGYLNGKIVVLGKLSTHGISMHPAPKIPCHVAYILNKAFCTFRSTVALNDDTGTSGSPVIFKVRGDGRDLWVSKPMNTSRAPQEVQVDISGVVKLELEIQTGDSDSFAHAVWVEPRVEKN